METLHIVLFLVGVVLCVIVIMVVNGQIAAKKRKKTKLGLVKVAGAGIDIGGGEPAADDTPAADAAVQSVPDAEPGSEPEPVADENRETAETADEPDAPEEPEEPEESLDYVEVDVDEEAVETMAMPMSAAINDFEAAKSEGADGSADVEKTVEAPKTPVVPKKRLPETVKMKDRMILLVEDVQVNRELVAMFFEDTGVKFDFAEDGIKAFEKFEKNPSGYSLILMDIQMPGMDGYDTARKIRALDGDWAKQIPIIAMTANVFKEDIDACFDAGMDDHIAKPLDMEALRDKVFEFMSVSAE